MRFIQGDQGLEVIDNPDIDDGSTLMIVKESYGNVLVPFLVDHYDKIYVVDFRYNDGDLVTFCKENNITDLMLSNNIQLIASTGVAAMYDAFCSNASSPFWGIFFICHNKKIVLIQEVLAK